MHKKSPYSPFFNYDHKILLHPEEYIIKEMLDSKSHYKTTVEPKTTMGTSDKAYSAFNKE